MVISTSAQFRSHGEMCRLTYVNTAQLKFNSPQKSITLGKIMYIMAQRKHGGKLRRQNVFNVTPSETSCANQQIAEHGTSLSKLRSNVLFVLSTAESFVKNAVQLKFTAHPKKHHT